MKRLMLIAARIGAGFHKQDEFVKLLQSKGIDITATKYSNIENGIVKNVDVFLALDIATILGKDPREIFLTMPTQKISQSNDRLVG